MGADIAADIHSDVVQPAAQQVMFSLAQFYLVQNCIAHTLFIGAISTSRSLMVRVRVVKPRQPKLGVLSVKRKKNLFPSEAGWCCSKCCPIGSADNEPAWKKV